MSDTFTLFGDKLNEIFRMDRAELDFGLYRIMNVKRREIERYIDEDLLNDELTKLEEQLTAAGVDSSSPPTVQELGARQPGKRQSDSICSS